MITALLVLLAMALISGTARLLWQILPGDYDDDELPSQDQGGDLAVHCDDGDR